MSDAGVKKPKLKTRIAAHVSNLNAILLVLVLLLMTIIAGVMIRNINDDAATNLARAYSVEAAQIFYSYISRDLMLVRKAAFSKAITEWCADEWNEPKRANAYYEMMDYITIAPDAHLYLGIGESRNEYTAVGITSLEDFAPLATFQPSVISDAWYFTSIISDNDYNLNIGIDIFINTWYLWINHKVFLEEDIVGIFCSGLRIPDVFDQIFGQTETIRGYIIDKYGFIQLASKDHDVYNGGMYRHPLESHMLVSHITDKSDDPVFTGLLQSHLASIRAFFDPHSLPIVERLSGSSRGYVSIAPIVASDWSVVIFYDSPLMPDIAYLLPLVIVMLSALFLYVIGRNALIDRLIFTPLGRLTQSVSEGKSEKTAIFGADRNDEIGELARAIGKATQERRDAQEHSQALLDAMPLASQLWNRDGRLFDCNEEAVKLYKMKDKQDYVDRFHELSPEYQSDGQLSVVKFGMLINKAFKEGRCVFEWMNQMSDGTPVPSEVTLARVKFGDEYVISSYARDLREHKQMMEEIGRQKSLLETMNRVSSILLEPYIEKFETNLFISIGMMAQAVEADRVYIWKNHMKKGNLYSTQLYEWSEGAVPQQDNDYTVDISYEQNMPGWQEILSQGKCINSFVRDMSPKEQAQLAPQGILSILIVPVFVRNQFWGFVGFDDCHRERIFTENEEIVLRSGSHMFANAMLRNEMARSIRDTAAKLEAVIANYQGIIWCVDRNSVITLFNGRYLSTLGFTPESFEGRKITDALKEKMFFDLLACIPKTIAGGAQQLSFETDGKTYSIRTTPILDNSGIVESVMGSLDDITERARLQKDLKIALEETEAASQAKSKFLASMSHEMRTPLNAIIGLSELVMEAGGLSEDANLNLEKIYNAGQTLLSTVNDILDISKIEAGKLELVTVEYDVPSLINDAITQNIIRIGEKPIQFVLDVSQELPMRLYGDDLRIRQVFNNLLSNAFKYTEKGTVEMSVNSERDGNDVWLIAKVIDTGTGIREENIETLFSDYSQLDTILNRKIEGTGLGLPITKRIVEMMDGSISVESEYGKGSVFTVRIKQRFVTANEIGPEVVKSLKDFRYLDSKRAENARLMRVKLPYARVLVVDDVVTNLDVAKGMMKPYDMQIDCMTSGREAISAIRSGEVRYNAVFMDHMMPELDGIETTRIIREEIGTDYAKNVPIIALTANAIVGNEEMFLRKGFQAFLSKPIQVARLDSVIREWVQDKEQDKKLAQASADGEPVLDTRDGKDRRSGLEQRVFGSEIPGLDMQKGLERFSDDAESYMQVLRSYAVYTRPLLEQIRNVNADNFPDYAIAVHGLKGSSYGICAMGLGEQAEALEKAAKAGDINYVTENNEVFIEAAGKVLNALDGFLAEEEKQKKDKPDSEVLKKLLEACEAYDMDGVDAAINDIAAFEYESDDGLAVWLKENVERMNFAQIKERLAGERLNEE